VTQAEGHEPVMVNEVLALLGEGERVLDLTVGAGGHAEALLNEGVQRVFGVDRDPEAIELATRRLAPFGQRFRARVGRFSDVGVFEEAPDHLDGVLYDLGVSSMQLDRDERGFSFRRDAVLDMRMGGPASDEPTAADLVNTLPERELADLLFRFGQERRSRQIAAAIVRRRPVGTTDELAGIVVSVVGRRPGGPHPARRTFQALRIAVNRELEELAASLPRAVGLLGPGGRVVVLSYHSLEDGIVKRAFRDDDRLRILTKKPLRPSQEETARNPRARSAKLRAAERIGEVA
jgi:16S rRNA (cytosine1402-N4)-methyltransferase